MTDTSFVCSARAGARLGRQEREPSAPPGAAESDGRHEGRRLRRPLTAGMALVRGNAVILANSGLLALGSASAAGLGFAYWWLAARTFPPAAVGAQSALISAMALIGLLGEAGFGTMLVGVALSQGDRAAPLITAAALAGTGAALVLALPAAGFL